MKIYVIIKPAYPEKGEIFMQGPIIIKLGGSLMKGEQGRLLSILGGIIANSPPVQPLLIVPGGGIFADLIRQIHMDFTLQEESCHFMAIQAMDQYAYLIHEFIPGSIMVDFSAAKFRLEKAMPLKPQILLTSTYFKTLSSEILPRNWQVTSDSLAAHLAQKIRADHLIIVKSTDINPQVKEPDVDAFFTRLMPLNMPLWFVNGRYPERLATLLRTYKTTGVYVAPGQTTGSIMP